MNSLDPLLAFHLTAAVMAVVVLTLAWNLLQRARVERFGMILNPYLFFPLLVSAVMVLTLIIGVDYLLFSLVLVAGLLLGFAHPTAALGFFISIFLLRPWELHPDKELFSAFPRLIAGITLFAWVLYRYRCSNWRIVWNLPFVIFLLFAVWLAISSLLAFNSTDSWGYFSESFFPILLIFFLVTNSIQDRLGIRAISNTTALSMTAVVLLAILNSAFGAVDETTAALKPERIVGLGMWSNSNDLAALAVLALPLIVVPWAVRTRTVLTISAAVLCSALLLFALYASQSRGALLAVVIGALALFLALGRLTLKRSLLLLILATLPILFYLGISRESSDLEGSTSSRLNYAVTALKMVRHHPLLGVGPGNYPLLFEQYTSSFTEWGQRTAHSSWVLVLAEGGTVGFSLFAALFLLVIRRAWSLRTSFPELLFAVVSYGVAMSFLSHTYLIPPYIIAALVIGASSALRTESARSRFEHDYFTVDHTEMAASRA